MNSKQEIRDGTEKLISHVIARILPSDSNQERRVLARTLISEAIDLCVRANVTTLEARVEELGRALEQAVSYGVVPSLPTCDPKGYYDELHDHVETDEEYQERHGRAFPYGEATVNFYGSDECDHPYNCPELAAYLASTSANGNKGEEGK